MPTDIKPKQCFYLVFLVRLDNKIISLYVLFIHIIAGGLGSTVLLGSSYSVKNHAQLLISVLEYFGGM